MTLALRRVAAIMWAGVTLVGCAGESAGPRASAAQQAACRGRADEVYDRQNRADIYRADVLAGGARDAAFSASGSPGGGFHSQLQARFAYGRLVDDCLRGVAGNVGATPDAPTPIGVAPASVAPALVAPGRVVPPAPVVR